MMVNHIAKGWHHREHVRGVRKGVMEREIDRFQAQNEAGDVFTIIVFQRFGDSRPLSGPVRYLPGSKRMVLLDGSHVNYIDAETFKIVETDEIIRKID